LVQSWANTTVCTAVTRKNDSSQPAIGLKEKNRFLFIGSSKIFVWITAVCTSGAVSNPAVSIIFNEVQRQTPLFKQAFFRQYKRTARSWFRENHFSDFVVLFFNFF
jgi:hypothetical protein